MLTPLEYSLIVDDNVYHQFTQRSSFNKMLRTEERIRLELFTRLQNEKVSEAQVDTGRQKTSNEEKNEVQQEYAVY